MGHPNMGCWLQSRNPNFEHNHNKHKQRMLGQVKESARIAEKTLVTESYEWHQKGQDTHRTHWIPPKAERVEAILGEEGLGYYP